LVWAFLITGVLGVAMGLSVRAPAVVAATAAIIILFAGYGAFTERPASQVGLMSLAAAIAFQVCYFVGVLLADRLRSGTSRK
jgi:hypothetical protein